MKTSTDFYGHSSNVSTGRLFKTAPPNNGAVLDGVRRRKTFRPDPKPRATRTKYKTPEVNERSNNFFNGIARRPLGSLLKNEKENQRIYSSNLQLLRRIHEAKQTRAAETPINKKVTKYSIPAYHKAKLTSNYPVVSAPLEQADKLASKTKKKFFHKKPKTKQEVFMHHIIEANNHIAPKFKKPNLFTRTAKALKLKPKILAAGAVCLAIMLLGSFLAYQNIPSIAMRVAASRAGFNGHLPQNTPAGFSFKGPIYFTKGAISLSYKSNSDSRNFVITQKPTDWTSETLMTDFLLSSKLQYQTFHDKGLTIYIYSEGSATWVDKGVWYNVTSGGALSSDQILAIAGGM